MIMSYIIEELKRKVAELSYDSTKSQKQEIEMLLRDVKNKYKIPDCQLADLLLIIGVINQKQDMVADTNILEIVRLIMTHIDQSYPTSVNLGKLMNAGDVKMKKDIKDVNSSYKLYRNFGWFNLWPK